MIGEIIGAGVDLFNGVMSAKAANNAAKAQLQATRETNKTNIGLAQQQRDWSERMVAQQNQYNSLAEQRRRAEEAGYSPYILTGQNSALQNEVPQYERANVQTPDYSLQQNAAQMLANIPSQVVGTLGQALQAQKTKQDTKFTGAQTKAQEIENAYRISEILAELDQKKADVRSKNAKSVIDELQGDILRSQSDDLKQRAYLENERIAQEASTNFANEMYTRSLVSINAKQYEWLDIEKRAQLAQTVANTAVLCSQRDLNLAQIKLAVRNAVIAELAAQGMRVDNRIKEVAEGYSELINDATLKLMRARTRNLDESTDFMPLDALLKTADTAVDGVGVAKGVLQPKPNKIGGFR